MIRKRSARQRDIRAAEIRVAQQRETISRLEEMGHATDTETLLLRTLEKELARLVGERGRLAGKAEQ
jgi:hypothetical protein